MIFRRKRPLNDPIVSAVRRWLEVRPVVSVQVLRPSEPVSSAETAGRTQDLSKQRKEISNG